LIIKCILEDLNVLTRLYYTLLYDFVYFSHPYGQVCLILIL